MSTAVHTPTAPRRSPVAHAAHLLLREAERAHRAGAHHITIHHDPRHSAVTAWTMRDGTVMPVVPTDMCDPSMVHRIIDTIPHTPQDGPDTRLEVTHVLQASHRLQHDDPAPVTA